MLNVKQHLIRSSTLSLTLITIETSDVGLGAVLSQTQQGDEVPIAYISHTLQPRQRSYAVIEKEALTCVWACETWEKNLLRRHFTVRTGYSSLAPEDLQFFAVRDELFTEDQCLLLEQLIVISVALRPRLLANAHEVAIDVTGPFLIAPQLSKFLVVVIDYKSKFPEVLMFPPITSWKVIKWLDKVFSRFGAPNELVNDDAAQFTSAEFDSFLKKYNVRHTLTAVYNPQENGCVQAFHANRVGWAPGIQALPLNYRETAATAQ
ncbi:retrovirus-related Pol polyprotein from transposon 297 [Elysia marginata]|uniref:Retrovirus-related Pol polyprotein from transposon 297 n=1 Tax=Elysia marginata TaxID=1093978 RepID=A0AAV4FIP4_9GAST|nr:retrovirus-related Pol polyprotein from transposon 297 [Elysia marginata]